MLDRFEECCNIDRRHLEHLQEQTVINKCKHNKECNQVQINYTIYLLLGHCVCLIILSNNHETNSTYLCKYFTCVNLYPHNYSCSRSCYYSHCHREGHWHIVRSSAQGDRAASGWSQALKPGGLALSLCSMPCHTCWVWLFDAVCLSHRHLSIRGWALGSQLACSPLSKSLSNG